MPDTPFAASHFLQDYGIQVGSESTAYLNIACPYCHGSSTSPTPLGIHRSKGIVSCWRCGSHSLLETITLLTGASFKEAREIVQDYGFQAPAAVLRGPSTIRTCPLPGGPLTPPFRQYLESRGLDPDWIALEHGVLAAGPKTLWHGEDTKWPGQWFSNRLIIPIHDRLGTVVNFQGRWIGKETHKWAKIKREEGGEIVEEWQWVPIIRYKGAQVDKVPVHHKHLLYGAWHARQDLVAVVEGVVDQWKMGRGTVATFGTTLTVHQIRELAKFRRILFCFDSEPEAQAKATKYARELAALGREAEVVDLELGDRDPGDLDSGEVGAIRRELGLD